jgi:hypothetical protein
MARAKSSQNAANRLKIQSVNAEKPSVQGVARKLVAATVPPSRVPFPACALCYCSQVWVPSLRRLPITQQASGSST